MSQSRTFTNELLDSIDIEISNGKIEFWWSTDDRAWIEFNLDDAKEIHKHLGQLIKELDGRTT